MPEQKMIEEVYTALAGVTFDNEDGVNRQKVIRYCKDNKIKVLKLVREIHPKDPNAVRVEAKIVKGDKEKTVQLGYVRNRTWECITCGAHYEKQPTSCICGSTDFDREGLATKLARAIDTGVEYVCTVEEYTGGEGLGEDGTTKNFGVNVKIEMLHTSKIGPKKEATK